MKPRMLDHVALWVEDRDAIAAVLTGRLGMHVIERTDRFTLLGADARHGKVTLFAADGPRDRGALRHIGLRVNALPEGPAEIDAGEGLRFVLVKADTDVDYDLDHVALDVADRAATAAGWRRLGFEEAGDRRVAVGGAFLELHADGDGDEPERPLLNHIGVLVDSVGDHLAAAERLGVPVEEVVDAPNTLALFVRGPDGVRLEYIEHKPSFALS